MGTKMNRDTLKQLRIGEGWIQLRVHGEPYVIATRSRYEPLLQVENIRSQTMHYIFMSAKTFMEGLEPLRIANQGKFDALQFRIRKESNDRYSPYLIEQ